MNIFKFFMVAFWALIISSCSNSPLTKMQSIAKDAQENGSSWSEDEWKSNSKDFQEAALEFIKSNPDEKDRQAGEKAAEDFFHAASKSDLKTIGTIVGTMFNRIQEMTNTAIEDTDEMMRQSIDDANEAMQRSIENANEAMQQSIDDANEAMQRSIEDANEAMQKAMDEADDQY